MEYTTFLEKSSDESVFLLHFQLNYGSYNILLFLAGNSLSLAQALIHNDEAVPSP